MFILIFCVTDTGVLQLQQNHPQRISFSKQSEVPHCNRRLPQCESTSYENLGLRQQPQHRRIHVQSSSGVTVPTLPPAMIVSQ